MTSLPFRARALSLVRKQGVAQFSLGPFQDHNVRPRCAIEKPIARRARAHIAWLLANKICMSRNNPPVEAHRGEARRGKERRSEVSARLVPFDHFHSYRISNYLRYTHAVTGWLRAREYLIRIIELNIIMRETRRRKAYCSLPLDVSKFLLFAAFAKISLLWCEKKKIRDRDRRV